MKCHLAQFNIARWKVDPHSNAAEPFFGALDRINQLADHSSGFVWRLKSEEGDATSISAFDDPQLLINLSVWESIESLREYAYRSAHSTIMRRRAEWFDRMDQAHLALWWTPVGQVPDVDEAEQRLTHLRQRGPSERAFTFAKPFPPPD